MPNDRAILAVEGLSARVDRLIEVGLLLIRPGNSS